MQGSGFVARFWTACANWTGDPRHLRRQARRIEEINRELSAELSRNPTEPEIAEIAERLGVPLEEFQRQLGELRGLDLGSLAGTGGRPRWRRAANDNDRATRGRSHSSLQAKSEMRSLLAEGIEQLEEKERQVLGLYYLEELTMKEVGILMDVGESRISQIHSAALMRLRSWLTSRLNSGTAKKGKRTR